MHPRIRPLALAVLLTATTGCVSVSAVPPQPPAAGLAPAGDRSAAPAGPERPAEPTADGELASTGPQKPPLPRFADERKAEVPPQREAPARTPAKRPRDERPDAAPAVQPDRAEQARSRQPRKSRSGVHPPRPRTHYDMDDLCRASNGVADPSFVALCRANYGR